MACPNHPEVMSPLVPCARCSKEYCRDCVVEIGGQSYDAVCKEEQLRDLRSGTVGPDLASAGRRFAGMFVDGLVYTPIAFLGVYLMANSASIPPGAKAVAFLIPSIFAVIYEAMMLASGGQTLGKKAAGIKVVNADGSELSPGQAWGRAISRNLMSITYVLGLVDAVLVYSNRRRTLHDRAARTLVVNWKR